MKLYLVIDMKAVYKEKSKEYADIVSELKESLRNWLNAKISKYRLNVLLYIRNSLRFDFKKLPFTKAIKNVKY